MFTVVPQPALLARHRVLQLPEGAIETCLIVLLARRGIDHRTNQGVVGFKGTSEMVRHMRGYHAGQHCRTQCLVAAVVVTITKPVNEIIAAQAQRSSAMQDEPPDRIFVSPAVRLN